MDDLLNWRKEFPILDRCNYLISNSLGAMPQKTRQYLRDYTETWASRGVRAWEEGWWEMAVTVGDILAGIIGAGAGEISLHQNVTLAEAIVFSALQPTPQRNKIVYSELNFPSVRYFYQAQENVQVEVVPCPDGVSVPLEALLEAIDDRTLLVPISHVIFKSSFLQDVARIIERSHEVGALVALDTYQSCGTVPFNVRDLDLDFAIGGSVKWLCGGPGVAYLYVKPDLRDRLRPRLTGWMAHTRPFDFEPEMDYSATAFRFLNGTPNIPGLYAVQAGYEIISAIGAERIRRQSIELTEQVIQLADEYGFQVNTPREADRRGGTVSINPPRAREVSRQLLRRNVIIDYRPEAGIRIGPHFYNTREEVAHAMSEMKAIVDGR